MRLAMFEFELVQLKAVSGHVDVCSAERSEESPRNRIHVIFVQPYVSLYDHHWVHFDDFEEDDNVWLENIVGILVDDEFFVPLARVMALLPHVKEFRCERQQEVDVSVCELDFVFYKLYLRASFPVRNARCIRHLF